MRSFLCSDGRSNKTLSTGSPTVEIKFTTAQGLKKCIYRSTMGKNQCGTTFLNQATRQLRESTEGWTGLIHYAGMDRCIACFFNYTQVFCTSGDIYFLGRTFLYNPLMLFYAIAPVLSGDRENKKSLGSLVGSDIRGDETTKETILRPISNPNEEKERERDDGGQRN